ncbi:alpha/beta hydrolase family protein [Castellaniella sp.]|uniref:alpha/beta hydrolase family protein n=1 Tax=Castellaniella sp. TaxID=1955812 RepID=UPI003565F546
MADSLERGRTRVRGFADPEMDFQLIRQLGATRYGGASVGECLALAARIDDADPVSWVQAFAAAGQRQEADAGARAARGHAISARDQYLIACNLYRAAEYYAPVLDPQHRALGLASRRCFLSAMHCGGVACEEWWFTLDDQQLPAYHVRAAHKPSNGAPARMLAIISGFDGTLEESWLVYGAPAHERGYDVLLFAGPGQMDAWRFNAQSHFRPDFERIGHVVVDRALALPHMQGGHVALMGISFGGYFATRIAAHEPRLGALIPNSPITDLHAYMVSFAGLDPAELPDEENFGPDDLAFIPDHVMNAQMRAMSGNIMLRMGQPSFRDTYRYLKRFRVEDAELARIACPSLALVGEGEGANPLQQAEHFVARVGGPVTRYVFTAEEGADGHCQSANPGFSAAVSMDWLDETFG